MKHNLTTFLAATAFVVLGFVFWETDFAYLILGGILLIYVAIVAYGSFSIQANYFFKSVNKAKGKGIALTFDDGPDPVFTPRILDILEEKGEKATFFVTGKKAEQHPELIRRMLSEGHVLGNHSYSHSYFIGFFSTNRLKDEIRKSNAVLYDITGKKVLYFRPPFGVTNPRYNKALKELGMTSIGWSLRSLDTKAKSKYELIDRILTKIKNRDIVLLHDNRAVTLEALSDIIEHCKQKGLKMRPLSEVIDNKAYDEN